MESLLIKGDNNKVLPKLHKNYLGKIDLIYVDIPFNTGGKFNSCEIGGTTVSKTANSKIAYSDNMRFDEYLSFIKNTLILSKPLLSEKGSIYLHIDCKTGHYIKIIMDEVFGMENFKNDITRIKSNPKNFERKAWGNQKDVILFYVISEKNIWNNVMMPMTKDDERRYNKEDEKGKYTTVPCHAPGETIDGETGMSWKGMLPPVGRHWRYAPSVLDKLDAEGRIEWSKSGNPRIKNYFSEKLGKVYQDVWIFKDPQNPIYPTEKNANMLDLIVKQSSNENSVVLDFFCGSGTTLLAAQKNGRYFIGVDSSEDAINSCIKKIPANSYKYVLDSDEILNFD